MQRVADRAHGEVRPFGLQQVLDQPARGVDADIATLFEFGRVDPDAPPAVLQFFSTTPFSQPLAALQKSGSTRSCAR